MASTTAVGWGHGAAAARAYADTFARLCAGTHETVLDRAGVVVGSRVLDVGAGTGDLAAAGIARGAVVTAVDPDAAMLAVAGRTAPSARLVRAGLPALPLATASCEVVLANFVVNHVPDPRAAVAELVRVSAPGARVVTTIWPSGSTEQARLWTDVLDEVGVVPAPATRLPADRDFERSATGLAELLEEAGLRDVGAEVLEWEHRAAPESLWAGAAAGLGGIGAVVSSQSEAVRLRLRAAYDRLVVAHVVDGLLVLRPEAVLAVGTR